MFYNGNKPKAKRDSLGEGDQTSMDRDTRNPAKVVGNNNTNKTRTPGGSSKKY